jgi:hypothetical protein
MNARFTYNPEELRELATVLARQFRRRPPVQALMLAPLLFLVGVFMLGLGVSWVWLLAAIIPILFLTITWRSYLGWPAPQVLDRMAKWNAEIDVRADDAGLLVTRRQYRTQYQWPIVERTCETRRLIVLHLAQEGYVAIPKRALGDDQRIRQLRELLSSRVTRQSRG